MPDAAILEWLVVDIWMLDGGTFKSGMLNPDHL